MLLNFIWGFLPVTYLFLVALSKFKLIFFLGLFENSYSISINVLLSFSYLLYLGIKSFRYKSKYDTFSLLLLLIILLPIIWNGPFFQPPSDPLFHAELLWDSFNDTGFNIANRDFIGKNIFKFFYSIFSPTTLKERVFILHSLHGLSAILMGLSVYFSSRIYGLPPRWSFFSAIVMFGFFGTDRFSFLGYYSLAPASLNFAFTWLLFALLFKKVYSKEKVFQKYFIQILLLLFYTILLIPILAYNHYQEVVFLCFGFVFLFFGFLYRNLGIWKNAKYYFYILFLGICFFPIAILQKYKISIPRLNEWGEIDYFFQGLYSYYKTPWIFFRVSAPRLWDTLGLMGIIPIFIFSILLIQLLVFRSKRNFFYKLRFIIPAILPFWIYLIPINLFVWLSIMPYSGEVFWRATYMSQYWITIAFLFYQAEKWIYLKFSRHNFSFLKKVNEYKIKILQKNES